MKDKNMTVIDRGIDAVQLVMILMKKVCYTELVSIETVGPLEIVGMEKKEMPTKEEEEPKKTEAKKIVSESADCVFF
ncbi:hypothetical protein SLE2022_039190 [Rubroshorea leprosula]